jgi:thimet oligopeptidase
VRTEWDFVEAPSQLLEEWTRDTATLQSFAVNAAGEPIPAALVAQLRDAEEFGKGYQVRRQMFLAALSLELHDHDPRTKEAHALAVELYPRYSPTPYVADTAMEAAFGHLNGYSAGYYTYMWSLVIAKDLFTAFAEKGLADPATAARYRRAILEPGGSRPAAELVKDFLGRPFDFRAYQAWLER